MTISRELAEFATRTRFADLPEATVRAVKRSLIDSFGVMAGGCHHEAVQALVTGVQELMPHRPEPGYTVVGWPLKLDIASAALVNGTMAHVLDFDDTIEPTRCHEGAPLVPALLATAQKVDPRGDEVITAFAVGFELITRLADAVYPTFALRGWHGTGIMGPPGTAAAVGRLLGLDADRMLHALALGATQSAGLLTPGTMSKSFNLGRAGASGLQAAILADNGFEGASDPFSPGVGHDRFHVDSTGTGYLELFSEEVDYDSLLEGLGERWAVERNGFKPFPSGFVSHGPIDGIIRLRNERLVAPEDVESIELQVCPEALELTGVREPRNGLQGKFSLYHAVAAGYIDGRVDPDTFTDRVVTDERYRRLAAKVTATVDPGLGQAEAVVELVAQGQRQRVHVESALGTDVNPMSDEQLQAKYSSMADPVFGDRADALLDLLWHLEDRSFSSVADLVTG